MRMQQEPETVIVTRHGAAVEYMVEQGIAPAGARVIAHATEDDVRGAHVIGFLPLPLAALAARVTTIALPRPPKDAAGRTRELTLEEIRAGAEDPRTYVVHALGGDAHSRLVEAAHLGCACGDCDGALTFHAGAEPEGHEAAPRVA